jgi:uncharacterized protein (TIGR03435 family)
MSRFISMVLCLGLAGVCWAQKPSFEAATVKVQDPQVRPVIANNPGRMQLVNRTLASLISLAYGVAADQIVGRPDWMRGDSLGWEQFEVVGTMPANTPRADTLLMLQSLLEDRFKLAVHRETQNFPGYELQVAKGGPKIKESTPGASPVNLDPTKPLPIGEDGFVIFPPGPRRAVKMDPGVYRVKCQEWTTGQLASDLPMMISSGEGIDPSAARPRVADKTGLAAKYDFVLQFRCARCSPGRSSPDAATSSLPPDAARIPTGDSGFPGIFTALEEQLGLRLVKANDVPLEVLVIDRVNRLPTQN